MSNNDKKYFYKTLAMSNDLGEGREGGNKLYVNKGREGGNTLNEGREGGNPLCVYESWDEVIYQYAYT